MVISDYDVDIRLAFISADLDRTVYKWSITGRQQRPTRLCVAVETLPVRPGSVASSLQPETSFGVDHFGMEPVETRPLSLFQARRRRFRSRDRDRR